MSRYLSTQVQNAFAAGNLQKIFISQTDTTAFYGIPDKKYLLEDYTRFPTMEEVLREYVTGVDVRKQGQNFHISVRDIPNSTNFEDDPLVLLDGVPVFDMNKIVSFDPLKIKSLEVVNRKYYFGNVVNSGILNYSTYTGDLAGFELDANAAVVEFEGLQTKREFFSPVYDSQEKVQSPVADTRNVLYWVPDISVSDHVEKKFKF
ncbi:MAG: TonB-dependent receptor plug domain-containing protein [Chitinophagaceae bacterium]